MRRWAHTGPNSENVISGGMVLGHGGNVTVIKTTPSWEPKSAKFLGCWHNVRRRLVAGLTPCMMTEIYLHIVRARKLDYPHTHTCIYV